MDGQVIKHTGNEQTTVSGHNFKTSAQLLSCSRETDGGVLGQKRWAWIGDKLKDVKLEGDIKENKDREPENWKKGAYE